MQRLLALSCLICLAGALSACDDEQPADAGVSDADTVDMALDVGLDLGPDAATDAAPDTAVDAGPDAAVDGAPDAACAEGETRLFTCPDQTTVPWCLCEDGAWQCADAPEDACGARLCDDGSPLECDAEPPACDPASVLAVRGGCWACVNPQTCRPWEQPGCASDADCAADSRCNPCAHGSCPECEDCVAECEMHSCVTEPEPACDEARPDCGVLISIVEDGCWVCVDRYTCAPPPPTECEQAGGYCAHFMDECDEGFRGGPPMDCPLGRSGQCCMPAEICVPLGEMVVEDGPACCAGLEPMACNTPIEQACTPCDAPPTCAACGNGICDGIEDACSCPADCEVQVPVNGCAVDADCVPRFWNVRCLGNWDCLDGVCLEICDFEGCGNGRCEPNQGESVASCSNDCGRFEECAPGETTTYVCPDGAEVPWCTCTAESRWMCELDPAAACRAAR